jgi:uncharacterized protein YjiS (DUF1127 family)
MNSICASQIVETRSTDCATQYAERKAGLSKLTCQSTDMPRFTLMCSLRRLLHLLSEHIRRKQQQRIDRDAFAHMMALSDEQLNDIGVTRDNVRWAANLPLEEDAALALREITQGGTRTRYR